MDGSAWGRLWVATQLSRAPRPSLRPFLSKVWATRSVSVSHTTTREVVLPTGAMHLVIRVSDHPLRIFGDLDDRLGRELSTSVVGGARIAPYIRDVSKPTRSVGAQLLPGACELLLGVPAGELSCTHTAVDDLWTTSTDGLREQLLTASSLDRQLARFEDALEARLPEVRGLHQAVAFALQRSGRTGDIRSVVQQTGHSRGRFIALFREAVGMSPKLYCQVRRFQGALERLSARPQDRCPRLRLDAGHSDQPHFTREFRRGHARRAPRQPNHLPIDSFKTARLGGDTVCFDRTLSGPGTIPRRSAHRRFTTCLPTCTWTAPQRRSTSTRRCSEPPRDSD